jgi:hypothetical protein
MQTRTPYAFQQAPQRLLARRRIALHRRIPPSFWNEGSGAAGRRQPASETALARTLGYGGGQPFLTRTGVTSVNLGQNIPHK